MTEKQKKMFGSFYKEWSEVPEAERHNCYASSARQLILSSTSSSIVDPLPGDWSSAFQAPVACPDDT